LLAALLDTCFIRIY